MRDCTGILGPRKLVSGSITVLRSCKRESLGTDTTIFSLRTQIKHRGYIAPGIEAGDRLLCFRWTISVVFNCFLIQNS
jgi:hypothetical protein